MEQIEISEKQLDKALVQDWQDICVGHYNLKLPPELLPLRVEDLRFDNYKFEVHDSPKTMHALTRKLQLEIEKLEVPDGLKSVIYRERSDKENQYLIAYRDGGKEFSENINIKGYINSKNKIVELTNGIVDGYGNPSKEIGDELNKRRDLNYQAGEYILDLIETIKDPSEPGKGYCLNNQIIIRGTHQTDGISAVKYYTKDFSSFSFSITVATYKPFQKNKDFLENLQKVADKNQGSNEVEVWKVKVNGLEGGMIKEMTYSGRGVAYVWAYIESKPYSKRPYGIKIEFKEQLESPYWGKQDKSALDEIFHNILASFYFRG